MGLNFHGLRLFVLRTHDNTRQWSYADRTVRPGNDQLNITEQNEKNNELLTDRVKRTNDIRETARQGRKRHADQFLQNTAKRHKLADLNVGDNVLIPVPDVDRDPTDARNVLAVVMEMKDDKYKLGVFDDLSKERNAFNIIEKCY
ncbi:unnamed protein product [Rotaria magnacalcarata]|uniref:Uncharacterized protein n=1 Tax=Rotaria magnacalcarata TaxID=392030 RepID=A0A816L117_9BILA|nr:unnamed protein product [Rotaria magnacalcarata]